MNSQYRNALLLVGITALSVTVLVGIARGWPPFGTLLFTSLYLTAAVALVIACLRIAYLCIRGRPREVIILGVVGGIALVQVFVATLDRHISRKVPYGAEGIPVVGNLKTAIHLHQAEFDCLPGFALGEGGRSEARDGGYPGLLGKPFADTGFEQGPWNGMVAQSFVLAEGTNSNGELGKYVPAYQSTEGTFVACDKAMVKRHFATHLEISAEDLIGSRLRPDNVQYAALQSTDRGDYLTICGVFGKNGMLAPGTGYAVLEVARSTLKRKEAVVWQRYDRLCDRQASFLMQPAATQFDPHDAATAHLCPIPVELLTSETSADFDKALATLRKWGWNRELRDPAKVRRVRARFRVAAACALLSFLSGALRRSRDDDMRGGIQTHLSRAMQLGMAGLGKMLATVLVMAAVAFVLSLFIPLR